MSLSPTDTNRIRNLVQLLESNPEDICRQITQFKETIRTNWQWLDNDTRVNLYDSMIIIDNILKKGYFKCNCNHQKNNWGVYDTDKAEDEDQRKKNDGQSDNFIIRRAGAVT